MAPSEPKDVDGGVVVSIQFATAFAGVPTLSKRFLANGTTAATELTGIPGVDRDDVRTSVCSFVRAEQHKQTPTSIENTFVESRLRGSTVRQKYPVLVLFGTGTMRKIRTVQVFKHDGFIGVHQLPTLLMQKVGSLVLGLAVCFRHVLACLLSAMRTTCASGQMFLRFSQLGLSTSVVAWVLDGLARRERGEVSQAQVNSNGIISVRECVALLDLAREGGVPLLALTLDGKRLDRSTDRTMQLDFERANLGEAQVVVMRERVAPLRIGETVVAMLTLVARIARCLPIFHTAKERFHSFLDSFEHILQDLRVDVFVLLSKLLDVRKLVRLVIVVHRFASHAIGVAPLLQGGVVEFSGTVKRPLQLLLLLLIRIQAVLEREVRHAFAPQCTA